MEKRLKVYDIPHKALRNALSQLSLQAGKTNYAAPAEVETLFVLGNEVFDLMDVHAEDENAVTLRYLESRCPGASKSDMDDHEELHETQNSLRARLGGLYEGAKAGKDMTGEGGDFYLSFSEFHSEYLEHT